MPLLARLLPAALVVALAAALAPAAHAQQTQYARTTPATGVSDTAATLTGTIVRGAGTLYQFEYGTERYDHYTPIRSVGSSAAGSPVSAVLTGLAPGTVYHFRLVAIGWGGAGIGTDQSFTTGPAVPATPPAPAEPAAIPAPVEPAPLPVAAPVVAQTMVVAPVAGTVRVHVPGQAGYTPLTAGASVPVGAVVDTRAGSVQLTSALADGTTQAGTFHGALFRVRQSAGGMTDLVLRGANFSACPKRRSGATGRAAAVSRRKPPVRRLWAEDKGGRFRTHGRNSVATVRGTRW